MSDIWFNKEHEYIRQQNGEFILGISDFAQSQLGDIVFVELPTKGKEYKKGDIISVIESVKAASDIYAPLDCTVIEINQELVDAPEIVNAKPETEGWLAKITIKQPEKLQELMNQQQYEQFIKDNK